MQIHSFILIVLALITAGCIGPNDAQFGEGKAMSTASNEALVRQVLSLIDERELDEAFELYSADYIYHGPGGQELRGRDGIRGLWELYLGGFPDLSSTIDDMISEGDKVVLRWTVRGTHSDEFLGIPATNQPITLPITEVFRIENGMLVEAWDQFDRLHLMEQIGAQ